MESNGRLISETKLITTLAKRFKGGMIHQEDLFAAITDVPTADAVEVVRCEKCLYRSQYADENGLYKCGGIQTEDGDLVLMVRPEHFCSHGDRRGKR